MKTPIVVLVVLLIAAGALAYDSVSPFRAHGSVVIKTKQYETMIVVRTGNDSGPADHVFHLWSKPALAVDGAYAGAEVDFAGSSLIFTIPGGKRVLLFTVAGYPPNAVPIPESFATSGYTIMGMNHEIGARAASHTVHAGPSPYEACDAGCEEAGWEVPDPWNYAGGGSRCYSGGVGSTSCSQTNQYGSCSVVCGMSTYACCTNGNPPSCTCKVYL